MEKKEILRGLPKIDDVLQQYSIAESLGKNGHDITVKAARKTINKMRSDIVEMKDAELSEFPLERLSTENVVSEVLKKIDEMNANKLYGVINATGTILHTNLGRAPLCKEAAENVTKVSIGYSDLEYDVEAGKRGSRHSIIQELICELTGAEDAMMVNNNASATLIVLSAMAAGREVVVSRGELVEIGGAFRIPDIMEQSGATLHEVGTTNKTKLADYKNAIDENTAALMKVHTSNYRIMGFTEAVELDELVALGKKKDVPVIFDMGNGLMVDLSPYGLDEPIVTDALETGVDVILFSGDKLLGGPQAGIIAGKKKYIEAMKKHPLARALRVDKMTFAAMEETLKKYRSKEIALKEIPVLSMITRSEDYMLGAAEYLAREIAASAPNLDVRVTKVKDQIGGGSAPMVYLDGYAVAVSSDKGAEKLEKMLRKNSTPIIARIHDDELLLCVRTIAAEEIDVVAKAFAEEA